jgi:hypothetical protein
MYEKGKQSESPLQMDLYSNSPKMGFLYTNDKAKHFLIVLSVKWNTYLKSSIGNGTFELQDGIASRMAKR